MCGECRRRRSCQVDVHDRWIQDEGCVSVRIDDAREENDR